MGEPSNLSIAINGLSPKVKPPSSARVLNVWIAQAQDRLGVSGPRLGWLVTATVVAAALQRAVDEHGSPRFLLKGGTLLQYRLSGMSRTTSDIDGLVRGDFDDFIEELDVVLAEPWGPLTLIRDPARAISVPNRIIKPLRFDIIAQLQGVTWRRVQVEVAPDEGNAGRSPENVSVPSLAGFGLPSPNYLVSLSMAYQVAQKIHACTDPHKPPEVANDRARDVVDLLLLRDLVETTGHPATSEIRAAVEDVFRVRALEAEALNTRPRTWPSRIVAYPHWRVSFASAADSAGLKVSLTEAVDQVNDWIELIQLA